MVDKESRTVKENYKKQIGEIVMNKYLGKIIQRKGNNMKRQEDKTIYTTYKIKS